LRKAFVDYITKLASAEIGNFFLDSGMNISDRKVCNGFWMLLAVLYTTTLLKENPIALQALMIFFCNVVLCE